MYFDNQIAKGIHTSEAYMYAFGGFEARLILRYPNPNHIKDVRDSPYFNDFQSFQYQNVNSDTIGRLKYLQSFIRQEVEIYELYIYSDYDRYPIHELELYGV